MTPQQIIKMLKAEGIELTCDSGNLKVRATIAKITDAQRLLIAANKPALLALLQKDERNCGSQARNSKSDTAASPDNELATEDFNAMVSLFNALLRIKKRAKGIGTDDSFTKKQKSNKSEVA